MSERADLYQRLRTGPMFERWHWLQWNFSQEAETPFARITLDALLRCDAQMPGYADSMLTTLEAVKGPAKNLDDYERIKQWLGELLVVHHFVTWAWPSSVAFEHEPTAPGSAANPEITVTAEGWRLGVEVKTPDLRSLTGGGRQANPWQLLTRMDGGKDMPGGVTLPRDNPIKDFLISSDRKFAGFRSADPDFYGFLFVVWDDFINEPISALLSPGSGLFTENSFDKDESGNPQTYSNVDGVVLLRHQHQFVEGMANRPPVDERRHFLDYGDLDRFPPNGVVPNLHTTREATQEITDALQAYIPDPRMGAEYSPAECVMWV